MLTSSIVSESVQEDHRIIRSPVKNLEDVVRSIIQTSSKEDFTRAQAALRQETRMLNVRSIV